MYLTGVDDVADCYFTYESASDKSTLYIPPVDPESVVWSGLPLSAEEAQSRYDVDEVLPSSALNATLAKLGTSKKGTVVHAIPDRVADHVSFLEFENKDFSVLGEAIDECRVVKDEFEIALIRHANIISGAAHKAVMEAVAKGTNEYELEGVFLGECIKKNAKYQAYPSIVASGRAAATLHYVHNNKELKGKDLLLLDAGAEWKTYASDIVSHGRQDEDSGPANIDFRHGHSPYLASLPRSLVQSTILFSRCSSTPRQRSRKACYGTISTCWLTRSLSTASCRSAF